MSDHLERLIDVPPRELMGPAMQQLNGRQQRFVCALAIFGGDHVEAYRWAGFKVTNDNSAGAATSRLFNSETVQLAIKEEAYRRLDSASMLAVSTLVEIASPRSGAAHKDRIKASKEILDRLPGFAGKTEQTIIIKDERTTQDLIDIIKQNAHIAGLDASKLIGHDIVEAEYEEVGSTEGLEDLI